VPIGLSEEGLLETDVRRSRGARTRCRTPVRPRITPTVMYDAFVSLRTMSVQTGTPSGPGSGVGDGREVEVVHEEIGYIAVEDDDWMSGRSPTRRRSGEAGDERPVDEVHWRVAEVTRAIFGDVALDADKV